MEDLEQPTNNPEQTTTPDETEQSAQSQGGDGSEVELTEEQQAEAAQKAEEEKAAQRQSAIDKRIAKLTWEKNDAIRKAQELEQKYASQAQSASKEPQLHEYDSIEDYANAISKFQADKAPLDKTYKQRVAATSPINNFFNPGVGINAATREPFGYSIVCGYQLMQF